MAWCLLTCRKQCCKTTPLDCMLYLNIFFPMRSVELGVNVLMGSFLAHNNNNWRSTKRTSNCR